ncbi:hypothetical protein DSM43518_01403 [Mycobacterium marinum]|uniref:Uncharacterized protein n=1 Tax=Mycobacterium marinum TaxID=1781 RepID=A0A3E2MV91_MYCMR|nr:hypothetical protein DE4381_01839 [Mycobacterium marinum]RFZ12783.1 hypothetical protein DSM43518_01403 [Mycobacterium marinum]RFZ22296.1 hypothetical protein VIMS_00159 [Mycobacterium marinum]RFZ26427.1 hypothetical protein DSM43519_01041 [Mycobacterium marinum]RFZ29275.1 hypothetical protein DSM44344_00898 [Mycobacterium marinum]
MLVQDVDVGFGVMAAGGHSRVAEACVAGRCMGTQPTHTQRQQQAAVAHFPHNRVRENRLEAGVQQCRVDQIAGLLGAHRTRQADLGEHRIAAAFTDMRRGQARERGAIVNSGLAEPFPQFVSVQTAGMGG